MKANRKKYVIQMEVTKESIGALGIDPKKVSYQKVGAEYKLVHLIETYDEKLYKAFMQPIWREEKRKEREWKADKTPISLEALYEDYKYEVEDYHQMSALERLEKEELFKKLNELVEKLNDIDKQIIKLFMEEKTDSEIAEVLGSKRTTINTKKHKIFSRLREALEDYL